MKISTKGRYGLRAMVDLGVYSKNEPVSISSIAERQQISDSYLEQLFGKLKKAGLVLSIRGAQAAISWLVSRRKSPWETFFACWRGI